MPDEELSEQQSNEEPNEELDEAEQAPDESGESDESEEEKSLEDELKEVIEVEVEDVGTLRKKLSISVPPDTLTDKVDDQYKELRRDAMVPGFRKGRAPRRLLEKRFGSEVSGTLVQQLVSTGYMAAIDKTGLKVIGDPLIWVKGKGKDEGEGEGETLVSVEEAIERIKMPDEGPLVFSCEVEIRPEFEMPNLEGIPIKKPKVAITDDDVSQQIERFRGMRGTYEPMPEGAVEVDDILTADIKMTSGETVLKEQEAVRLAARPQQVEGITLEKLGESLTGAKVGDVVKITTDIPEDYAKAEFRGKQAELQFKIREIQRPKLPEMNEEFITSLGFESEKEMQDFVRSQLEASLDEKVQQVMSGELCQYLLDNTSFELPERLSSRQVDQVVARTLLDLYQKGMPPAEVEKHVDELRTSAREDAIRDMKLAFIMEKLSDDIEVEVTEGEMNSRIATIAQQQGRRFDRVRDELNKGGNLQGLYLRIREEKILNHLLEKAQITETEPKADEEKDKAKKKPAAKRKPPAKGKGKAKSEDKAEGDLSEET